MAVPRNRHSTSRKNTKRAHHAKKVLHLVTCSNCNTSKRPHAVCLACGSYGGRTIISQEAASQE